MDRLEEIARQVAERRFLPPDDDATEKTAPLFWELLTKNRWGDGTERILPRLIVEPISGGYRVTYQDDSLCVRKSVAIQRLADLAERLEAVLSDPDVPWEPFKSYRNKKGPPIPVEEKRARRKRS